MASVWCAHDRVLGRRVALKVLSPQFARDEAGGRRFVREGRAAARLSGHSHVVTIFDIGAADGVPYIVMEYLAGGTVADAIRVHAVDREQALKWIQQAASALDYAHAQGIVHRDVKPANLLLDRDRTLHVADFGIAHIPTEDTFTSVRQVFGTAAYASPEQVRGERGSEASDRYALAVAAFELLVGERPFVATPATAQARQHLEEQPPRASERNSTLPEAVDEVLARGMAKRPEDRWPTAEAFAVALANAAADRPSAESKPRRRPLVALAPGGAARAGAEATRRRRPSGRALALAALAAAAAAVAVVVGTEANGPTRSGPAAGRPGLRAANGSGVAGASGRSGQALTAGARRRRRAAALAADGHKLMVEGDYAAAVPVLRQAVAVAAPGASQYASALLDLGRSLRLEGDPQAAIRVLERRLKIPGHTQAVVTQLELAQLADSEGAASASATTQTTAASTSSHSATQTTTTSSTSAKTSTSTSTSSTQSGGGKPRHGAAGASGPRSTGSGPQPAGSGNSPAGGGGASPGGGSPASGGAAPFPSAQTPRAVRPPRLRPGARANATEARSPEVPTTSRRAATPAR